MFLESKENLSFDSSSISSYNKKPELACKLTVNYEINNNGQNNNTNLELNESPFLLANNMKIIENKKNLDKDALDRNIKENQIYFMYNTSNLFNLENFSKEKNEN